jgi:class 3 adenylate cyclase
MQCSACGAANPEDARFCGGCGAALARPAICPRCSAPTRPDQRFCNACGTPLAAPAAEPAPAAAPRPAEPASARKVVTIVFADLTGSTALQERLDAESVRRFMDAYYQAMRGAVEAHGGTLTQLLGDGVKAVFGAPRVAEDDAIRAVRAAMAMQRAFAELLETQGGLVGRTGLRVAVNTGEVVASGDTEIIGDPVNVAARLQEQACDGDVVIGEATRRLVSELVTLAPLGVFALKGRSESVAAYRVVSLDRPAGAFATPFVGREVELRQILAVYESAVDARRARLAVVLGSPGLGKSRVIGEVARRLGDDATMLSAHCDGAGGATFAPIAEALRELPIDDILGGEADRARIAGGIRALLSGAPAPPEETFFVVRRFLAAFAAAQPVVLVIDDLQWAEPLLLDLTEHLVQWTTDVPLLVLVAARPELREARSSLATPGGLVSEVVTLSGLDALAAMKLAANAIGAEELPAAVAGRVLATSEGNPLFVGELVRMLVQDGTLVREGERWTVGVELAGLEMPPTIQALLAARIERLRPEERTVLERAAVVGRQFSRAAVKELLPREIADFDRLLESLRRSELVEPDTGWFLGEPALRFHHVLIRDAAYRRLLKNTRAELHERFADWVEKRVGEAAAHDETLGWHLEQAHRHLRELGPLDAHGRALGERAARVLAEAGRRALARDDVPLAASLLGRALAALDAEDPARAELALDWCEALLAAGEVGEAAAAIDELGRFAGDSPRLRAWHTCFAGERAALVDPQSLRATADAVAVAAEQLAGAADTAGEAKAHFVHAIALARLGRIGACEAALDRALAAARRGRGDRRRANAVLSGAPQAALWGPSPVTRASGRCLDVVRVLRITQGAPAVEAIALRCQGVLEALRGRSDAARRMIATSRRMVEELGITQRLLETEMFAGQIELIEGDPAAAEARLRPAYQGLREHGLGIDAAQAAAMLGRAMLAQDHAEEAEALSHESEALAGDDLRAAVAWRGVRAEALARRGEHAAAIELARAAVEIAAATDALLYHADARTALGAALRAAGRGAEAAAEDARAIELWDAKGATLLVERARREQTRVASPTAPARESRTEIRTARRVASNAATERFCALARAMNARDAGALEALADTQSIDRPTGRTMDRREVIRSLRGLLDNRDLHFEAEPVAALGDTLALVRCTVSGSGVSSPRLDVGDYSVEQYFVEYAERGRFCNERFGGDHLGDAVVRLYEHYVELLPPGAERDRAAATAHSVAALLVPIDPDLWATAIAPDVEWAGQGPVAYPPGRGAQTLLNATRGFLDVGSIETQRTDDVLALTANALLRFGTTIGTDRAEGGSWEHKHISLFLFGADGLMTRVEMFEPDRAADALARFDALTAELPTMERRVRPNAATAFQTGLECAVIARDVAAISAVFPDDTEIVDHPAGATFTKSNTLSSLRALLASRDLSYRAESIAALGDLLALTRIWVTASGITGGGVDVADYSSDELTLTEVDPDRHRLRAERFAPDRLGDAIARLYERYAVLLSPGPARDRAVAIARSVGTLREYPDRWAFAPDVEVIDHRSVGHEPVRGRDEVIRTLHAMVGLIEGRSPASWDDVLATRPGALLARRTHSGVDRASGGQFERAICGLITFGSDGLITRWERFDHDRAADALARFDALTAELPPPTRRVRPNRATAHTARLDAAITQRDPDALTALFAEDSETLDHTIGADWDRAGLQYSFQSLLRAPGAAVRHEPIATLGERFVLLRYSASALSWTSERLDVGPYETERIVVGEVDESGRSRRVEAWPGNRLHDGVVRLYECYAESLRAGPERERAVATARAVAATIGPLDLERSAATLAPDLELADHRSLIGIGSARGAEAVLGWMRTLLDVADGIAIRFDDVLDARPELLLTRTVTAGTDRAGGGAFERQFISLVAFGADGRMTRWEQWDADRADDAFARVDELTAEPARPARHVQPNAATAAAAGIDAAFAARDAEALAASVRDSIELVDHINHVTQHRSGLLDGWTELLAAEELRYGHEVVATLGGSLALCRLRISGSGNPTIAGVGRFEHEPWIVAEVDRDRHRREIFAADRLGEAIARLYERYAELLADGPGRARAAAIARSFAVAELILPVDLDRWAAALSPSIEFSGHGPAAFPSGRGAQDMIRALRGFLEVGEITADRTDDVLALRSDALVRLVTTIGTDRAGGGTWERHVCQLWVFGADGLMTRWEEWPADQVGEALARFDELMDEQAPAARRVRRNAATAYSARVEAAFARRDLAAYAALLADEVETIDHPNGAAMDRQGSLRTVESLMRVPDLRFRHAPVAALGDSLALSLMSVAAGGASGTRFDVGAYSGERFDLIEVDERGRYRRAELFARGQLGDALTRLYERYAESLPSGTDRERATAIAHSLPAVLGPFDTDRFIVAFADAAEMRDHRALIGIGTVRGKQAIAPTFRLMAQPLANVSRSIDDVLAARPDALLFRATTGSTDRSSGAAYEWETLVLLVFGAEGLVAHAEWFDAGDVADALARFDQLCAERNPLRIPDNAASRAIDRIYRDRSAAVAWIRDDFSFEDRGGRALTSGGAVEWLGTQTFFFSQGGRPSRELIGTRGDRIMIERVEWTGEFELDLVAVAEVDAEGGLRAVVRFDADDLDAAFEEAEMRFLAGEAAGLEAQAAIAAFRCAIGERDWEALKSVLTTDFANCDHRTLGVGAENADELIASLRALADLSPDFETHVVRLLEWNRHGRVAVVRQVGSALQGGGPFENSFLSFMLARGDRVCRQEVFDITAADAALARFAELCAERERVA